VTVNDWMCIANMHNEQIIRTASFADLIFFTAVSVDSKVKSNWNDEASKAQSRRCEKQSIVALSAADGLTLYIIEKCVANAWAMCLHQSYSHSSEYNW
jgi:hypothetical protein